MFGDFGAQQTFGDLYIRVDHPGNKHRHVSQLFALHPGRQISVETMPELAEAAKTSLQARGDGGTGWKKTQNPGII